MKIIRIPMRFQDNKTYKKITSQKKNTSTIKYCKSSRPKIKKNNDHSINNQFYSNPGTLSPVFLIF